MGTFSALLKGQVQHFSCALVEAVIVFTVLYCETLVVVFEQFVCRVLCLDFAPSD